MAAEEPPADDSAPAMAVPEAAPPPDLSEWEERAVTIAMPSRRASMLPPPVARQLSVPDSVLQARRSIAGFGRSASSEDLVRAATARHARTATEVPKDRTDAERDAAREAASTYAAVVSADAGDPGRAEPAWDGPPGKHVTAPPAQQPEPLRVILPSPPDLVAAQKELASLLSPAAQAAPPPPLPSTRSRRPSILPIPLAEPVVPPVDLPPSTPLSAVPPGALPAAALKPEPPLPRKSLSDDAAYGPDRVGNYDLGPVAGTGTFATVRLARHYATGQPAVCKLIVFPEPADPRDRLHFFALREGAVMMALPPHPNVATLYEYHRSDAHVELVMSLAPGEELFSYAEKIGGAPEDECRNIAAQLLAALDHMHTHSVLHRDIKLDNVFYDPATQKVTVIDFGLATFYHPQVRLVEIIGTPSYASPPLLAMLEDGYGGMLPAKGHQDLWAFGVTLYGLATCRFPFEETDIPRLQREIILKGKKERPFPLPDSWDPERRAMAEDFLKTVLDPDNEGKITARSLLAHPWLAAGGQPPRVPISRPTPSFVTPTRELADAGNYARCFAELARLVAAKMQSRNMRLAIPFGGGNLGASTAPGSAVPARPASAASGRPGTPSSVPSSPALQPVAAPQRTNSALSMPSSGGDDSDRHSFESDGTAVGIGAPDGGRKKKGGLRKFWGKVVSGFH